MRAQKRSACASVNLGTCGDEYGGAREYFVKAMAEREKLGLLLKSEGVAAVVVPSRCAVLLRREKDSVRRTAGAPSRRIP